MVKKLPFSELNLSKEVLKAISDMGFEEASPIQSEAIPYILAGRDVIGQAMTGTGKTAAFGIPAVELVDVHEKVVQVLVLCPTRELAVQVSVELNKLAAHKKGISILPIYGGQDIERQIQALRRGVHIVIGTPGRVLDHLDRKTLRLDAVKMAVLDEADEMLDMGFRDDIEAILKQCAADRQTVLFSATMAPDILRLAQTYQKNAQMVKVVHEKLTTPDIEQVYFEIDPRMKLELLTRLIDINGFTSSIVFCNTKRRVDEVVSALRIYGYAVEGLHGDIRQEKRNRIMEKFRKGDIEILVATDVAARGIDVPHVEAIFNFEIPCDEESYVHRIGRTGRAGRRGKAFSFVSGREFYGLRDIMRYTKATITQQQVPSLTQVEELKTNKLLADVKAVLQVQDHGLGKQLELVERLMKEDHTSLEVAAAALKLLMDKEMPERPVVQLKPERREEQRSRPQRRDGHQRSRRPDFGHRSGKARH